MARKKQLTEFDWQQVHEEIMRLFDILRDAEFKEECTVANHQLKLCGGCNLDLHDVMRRVQAMKGRTFKFLSNPED